MDNRRIKQEQEIHARIEKIQNKICELAGLDIYDVNISYNRVEQDYEIRISLRTRFAYYDVLHDIVEKMNAAGFKVYNMYVTADEGYMQHVIVQFTYSGETE